MARVTNSISLSSGSGSSIIVVANYSELPDPTTVSGEFYWAESSQGTSWLPGSIGGTYYNSGMYYSNGTTWTFMNVPYQATQEEVIAGINTDKFVTPFTLKGVLPTKTSDLINDGDDGNHFISLLDLPSNIIFYPTNVASDISGYVKIVTSITDPDYNNPAEDVPTGAITTTNQLISSLATAPNIIVGNPGVFNITTIGNIRRISGSGEASFYFQVYKRTSAGVETLIATSDNTIPVIDGGTYIEFSATAIWDDGEFLDTDRVVMKYYANRIAGGSNPTYEFQFGGVTPVRTLVPIPLSVVPVLTIDAVPTDGSTNAVSSNGVFDGLFRKPNISVNDSSLATAVAGETHVVIYQKTFPANTFQDLDVLEYEALVEKFGTTAGGSLRVWCSNNSVFNSGTAQLLSITSGYSINNLFYTQKREMQVRGTNVRMLANTVNATTDESIGILTTNTWANYAFDNSTAITIFVTITGNAADTFRKNNFKLIQMPNIT